MRLVVQLAALAGLARAEDCHDCAEAVEHGTIGDCIANAGPGHVCHPTCDAGYRPEDQQGTVVPFTRTCQNVIGFMSCADDTIHCATGDGPAPPPAPAGGETIIAVPVAGNLCPPYAPACVNTFTSAGASVGDTCFIPCATLGDGTRWCPTTAVKSGNDGTPWGWCANSGPAPGTNSTCTASGWPDHAKSCTRHNPCAGDECFCKAECDNGYWRASGSPYYSCGADGAWGAGAAGPLTCVPKPASDPDQCNQPYTTQVDAWRSVQNLGSWDADDDYPPRWLDWGGTKAGEMVSDTPDGTCVYSGTGGDGKFSDSSGLAGGQWYRFTSTYGSGDALPTTPPVTTAPAHEYACNTRFSGWLSDWDPLSGSAPPRDYSGSGSFPCVFLLIFTVFLLIFTVFTTVLRMFCD